MVVVHWQPTIGAGMKIWLLTDDGHAGDLVSPKGFELPSSSIRDRSSSHMFVIHVGSLIVCRHKLLLWTAHHMWE